MLAAILARRCLVILPYPKVLCADAMPNGTQGQSTSDNRVVVDAFGGTECSAARRWADLLFIGFKFGLPNGVALPLNLDPLKR